tara:strand:+ start:882 stop:2021 length:1140 start_codon:yes stop_codon:yes gene_type:complete
MVGAGTTRAQESSPDLAKDVAAIATAQGLSTEEVNRRLELQAQVAELEARLKSDPTFGGLYIDASPSSYRVVVKFTANPSAKVSALVTDPSLLAVVQAETALVPLSQLEAAQESLLTLFATLQQDTGIRIDVREGAVIGLVRNPTRVAPLVETLELSRLIRLQRETQFPLATVAIKGGQTSTNLRFDGTSGGCTTAFGVSGSGITGVSQAGHCVQLQPGGSWTGTTVTTQGASLTTRNALWDSTRDFMWAAGTGHSGTNLFYDGQGDRAVTSTATALPANGSTMCKYGRSTGYACILVTNNSYRGTDAAGNIIGPIVELGGTSGNIAQCGDSGGPIFLGNQAHGITSRGDVNGQCQGGSRLYYIPISRISGLGVTVLTQ